MRQNYLNRLEYEIRDKRTLFGRLDNIYLGGGTPTHFSLKELQKLLYILTKYIPIPTDCEFTIEGNPTCFTKDKIKLLLDNGVNRFSIGVQSFSDETRRTIGRAGDASRVSDVVDALRSYSIKNYNLDLIFGTPNQSIDQLRFDLEELIKLSPSHISAYSLMIKEKTPLAQRFKNGINDDLFIKMWPLVEDKLKNEYGMYRYEISNFCKPGYECRHNYNIWKGGRFLGIGPSACYFDGVSRWTNPVNFSKWMDGIDPTEDYLDGPDRAVEILLTGLRTRKGWERSEFKLKTGFDYNNLRSMQIDHCVNEGLMHKEENCIRLTEKGMLLSDYVERELI